MVDKKALDQLLCSLIDDKIALHKLDYSDANYDEIEERIHEKEDQLIKDFGGYLEDALHEVHDEFCPDSEVLLPIAYLPHVITKENDDYKVDFRQGAYVEVDDYPGTETKLVILPSPTRIILQINAAEQLTVWQAKD